jgi:hypothetical protein
MAWNRTGGPVTVASSASLSHRSNQRN